MRRRRRLVRAAVVVAAATTDAMVAADRVTYAALADGELARRVIAAGGAVAGREAEAELARRLGRRVWLYGRRHLSDADGADELVQRVMMRLLEKLRRAELRQPDQVGSFALGIARHVVKERHRQHARDAARSPFDETAAPPAAVTSALAEAPWRDPLARDRLAGCVAQLGERERAVLTLTYFAGQSSSEIARALGLGEGNVRVMRHRSIAQLRDCMRIEEAV